VKIFWAKIGHCHAEIDDFWGFVTKNGPMKTTLPNDY
jgi:hypothetical protein